MIEYPWETKRRSEILQMRQEFESKEEELAAMQASADPEIEARLAAARSRNNQCFQDGA
jgi:hypothetical protein